MPMVYTIRRWVSDPPGWEYLEIKGEKEIVRSVVIGVLLDFGWEIYLAQKVK